MTGLIGQLANVQKRLAVPYRGRKSWSTAKLMNLNNAFTSQARFQTTIEDPTYKGLFYHSTHDAANYSLSFISDLNKVEKFDISVIGWIPFQTGVPKLTVGNFKENSNFIKFLHQVIADNVADADPQLQALAKYQQNGWLHIADVRDPAPWGRIPYPEDIFGMVQVKGGLIIPGTYQPMPTHRILTTKGLFMLNVPFHEKLLERLSKICR
ncbi:10349_t:CDS:2 [Cetraspora pellucida]|uniref:10349_t:CDS:1 n=1 Tax=Cetraspora pellucida TaxID=1433469 RepID=A0A9N8Z4P9_9GLOM|nr:10349_t:CDS:2 [Cetraspora pellucida]